MEANEYFYWCFICKKECFVIETDDGELQCENCNSTFVEELPPKTSSQSNQIPSNIESSNLPRSTENSNAKSPNKNISDKNELLPSSINNHSHDLGNIRGLNNENNLIDINSNVDLTNHLINQNRMNINTNSLDNENSNSNYNLDIDDPRNFVPVTNNINNNGRSINGYNNNTSGVSFSQERGNSIIQFQINSSLVNTLGGQLGSTIANTINSIFTGNGNNNGNLINLSNNTISLNLNTMLGNQVLDLNSFLGRDINDNAFENLLNILMNFDRSNGNPPASKAEIQRLKRINLNDENIEIYNKESCIICVDEFAKEQTLINLECNHFFHEECIISWLKKRNQCPICRKEFKTDDQDYENRRSQNRTFLNNWRRYNNRNDYNHHQNNNHNGNNGNDHNV